MSQQTPEERIKYQQKLKFLHDAQWRLDNLKTLETLAEARGFARGEARGRLLALQDIQESLGVPLTSLEELTAMNTEQLEQLRSSLKRIHQSQARE